MNVKSVLILVLYAQWMLFIFNKCQWKCQKKAFTQFGKRIGMDWKFRTVSQDVPFGQQTFLEGIEAIQHHHPFGAHFKAVHIPIFLCKLPKTTIQVIWAFLYTALGDSQQQPCIIHGAVKEFVFLLTMRQNEFDNCLKAAQCTDYYLLHSAFYHHMYYVIPLYPYWSPTVKIWKCYLGEGPYK